MNNIRRLTDTAIGAQLGASVRAYRLRQNMTQHELANAVGVSTPTIQNLEKGKGALSVLIGALRALNRLDLLSELLELPRVSPLRIAEAHGRVRKRASGQGKRKTKTATQPQSGNAVSTNEDQA